MLAFARPGGEDLPFVYAGTLVTAGSGVARVHATGPRTEIGRIGQAMQTREAQETPLQARDARASSRSSPGSAGRCPSWRRSATASRATTLLAGVLAGLDAGDGDPAERVPRRRHDVPRARRLAPLATQGARAAHPRGRVARRGHGAVRGQDGHADREPHDGQPDPGERRVLRRRAPPRGGPPRVDARDGRVQHPGEPAGPVRPDGARLQGARRRSARGHRAPARRLAARARVPADARAARGRPGLARPGPRAARRRGEGRAGGDRGLCGASAERARPDREGRARARRRGPARARGRAIRGGGWPRRRRTQATFGLRFVGLVGLVDPVRDERARGRRGVPQRRDSRRDDHRRLPVDRGGHRAAERASTRRASSPARARRDERRRAAGARPRHERLRSHAPGAEAPPRRGARGQRRDRRR